MFLRISEFSWKKSGQHLSFSHELDLEEIFEREAKKTTLSTRGFFKDNGGWWSQEGEEDGW